MPFFKTILSLYDFSGEWSKPYREADGYRVIQYDLGLDAKHDVRLLKKPKFKVHGILAAPPCTVFASSGAWVERTKEEMLEGLSMVDAVFRLVTLTNPKFWVLENPVGKLSHYIGPPRMWFDPFWYGDPPYTKKTGLWGRFNRPRTTPIKPTEGSKITEKLSGTDKRGRSKTPAGFARAFFLANP